jgi:hypothetical protein
MEQLLQLQLQLTQPTESFDGMRGRKDPLFTSLLSECPKGNHNKCRVTYYNKYKSNTKEMCMCRCHDHAKPPMKEEEPVVGIIK